jgi:hypothetical protein
MQQLRTEEKAALLLASVDEHNDEDDIRCAGSKSLRDGVAIRSKHSQSSQRYRTSSIHPFFLFIFIMCAFIFGCLSGVVILLYRWSQDAAHTVKSPELTHIDLTIQSNLLRSITNTNFLHLNR